MRSRLLDSVSYPALESFPVFPAEERAGKGTPPLVMAATDPSATRRQRLHAYGQLKRLPDKRSHSQPVAGGGAKERARNLKRLQAHSMKPHAMVGSECVQ